MAKTLTLRLKTLQELALAPVDDCDLDSTSELSDLDPCVNPSATGCIATTHKRSYSVKRTGNGWFFGLKHPVNWMKYGTSLGSVSRRRNLATGVRLLSALLPLRMHHTHMTPQHSPKGVICVYTTKEAIDEVGLLLIQNVRHTIRYKTDEATLKGLYAFKGHGKDTIRTLYWNDGKPSFGPHTLLSDVNPTSINDDVGVYCKPLHGSTKSG